MLFSIRILQPISSNNWLRCCHGRLISYAFAEVSNEPVRMQGHFRASSQQNWCDSIEITGEYSLIAICIYILSSIYISRYIRCLQARQAVGTRADRISGPRQAVGVCRGSRKAPLAIGASGRARRLPWQSADCHGHARPPAPPWLAGRTDGSLRSLSAFFSIFLSGNRSGCRALLPSGTSEEGVDTEPSQQQTA